MKLTGRESNEVILKEIGKRIKDKRVSLSLTQKDLAEKAGVSTRTITYAESGENTSLSHILSIMRVLKISGNIDILIPEVRTNPLDVLKYGHKRERASSKKVEEKTDFKWGNDK